jgi:hypothetical protein
MDFKELEDYIANAVMTDKETIAKLLMTVYIKAGSDAILHRMAIGPEDIADRLKKIIEDYNKYYESSHNS